MKRMNVLEYDSKTPLINDEFKPANVKVMLKQHVGNTAVATVKIGEKVKTGDLIGDIEEGKLGARVHASIDGKITHVSEEFVRISAN